FDILIDQWLIILIPSLLDRAFLSLIPIRLLLVLRDRASDYYHLYLLRSRFPLSSSTNRFPKASRSRDIAQGTQLEVRQFAA
ncbi:MAG: hypothetical protein GVY04_05880, partial [Cyanobacteria bacterium]|nr:hypothetical protein [Cyanobacteria bacterium GSL.Bin1]